MIKLSNLEKNYIPIKYIPIKKYNYREGGEFIGEIKDSKDFQYIGDAINSYGEVYYLNSVFPFAKIKAYKKEEIYDFVLFVNSKKLSSTELKKLNSLSVRTRGGSIINSLEYKRIKKRKSGLLHNLI